MRSTPQQIDCLWFELFHILVKQMLLNGIDAKSYIYPPIDGVNVEVQLMLLLG